MTDRADTELGDQQMTSQAISSKAALAHRPASVTHGEPLGGTEDGDVIGELPHTRSLYGIGHSPDTSKTQLSHRMAGPSRSFGHAHRRTQSRISVLSRSESMTSQAETVRSGRQSFGVPIPRGFLSPKKTAAALEHEQQEKVRGAIRHQDRPIEMHDRLGMQPIDETAEELSVLSARRHASGPADELHRPPDQTNHSMTDMSSPPRGTLRDLHSTDDLVRHSSSSEKPLKPFRPGSAKRKRRLQSFDNPLSTWFCGGHLMTGGDSYFSMIFTLIIILGMSGVWVGTTGVWLWQHGTEYGLVRGGGIGIVVVFIYLFGMVISSLVVAAVRDPGIIPRRLDMEPPMSHVESWYEPMERSVKVGKNEVPLKYCETCQIYRPPRCSHCRLCGNCVDGIDHHCAYIHNCVGKRNYLSFLTLLVSGTIGSTYVVVFSAIHFALICHHEHVSFRQALKDSPGAAVSFLLGVFCLPAVTFLLYYHARLMLYNLTTVEQIRASESSNLFRAVKRPDNPFSSKSIMANIVLASIGRPQFPSWLNASKWETEDRRVVNPALVSPQKH